MDKQRELNNITDLVKGILTDIPAARNSDNLLYIKVVDVLNSRALDKPFGEVMANLEDLGLPCFETVRRTRQKVQMDHPELKADEKVQSFRAINEEIYKEYARN